MESFQSFAVQVLYTEMQSDQRGTCPWLSGLQKCTQYHRDLVYMVQKSPQEFLQVHCQQLGRWTISLQNREEHYYRSDYSHVKLLTTCLTSNGNRFTDIQPKHPLSVPPGITRNTIKELCVICQRSRKLVMLHTISNVVTIPGLGGL